MSERSRHGSRFHCDSFPRPVHTGNAISFANVLLAGIYLVGFERGRGDSLATHITNEILLERTNHRVSGEEGAGSDHLRAAVSRGQPYSHAGRVKNTRALSKTSPDSVRARQVARRPPRAGDLRATPTIDENDKRPRRKCLLSGH